MLANVSDYFGGSKHLAERSYGPVAVYPLVGTGVHEPQNRRAEIIVW
jgi:hypothetical protein